MIASVSRPHWANRLAPIALGLIICLGAILRFYELGSSSLGNAYYAATVNSMLTSWHNFFFASFEPGGSVTVDKPPLGFWVQAVSVYFLGLNGFALALPQALAGVLSLPLIYHLVKQPFGRFAGIIAALVLAIAPVTIATERNNTIDGLLLFVLLLASWAVWRSVRRHQLRYLLLMAFLVGVGFNIKMLQAIMPLPAFYLLYWFGTAYGWPKRLAHLSIASLLLVTVSLSWAIAVDLTPATDRPFIGSSHNNRVLELIVGHNGLSRLGLGGGPGQPPPPADRPPKEAHQSPTAWQPPPRGPNGGRPGGPNEVGRPGPLRLLTAPLAPEAGWLLPFLALSLPWLINQLGGWRSFRQRPLSKATAGFLLWGSWLVAEMIYFSFTGGLFHVYYLIMLGPPLAALMGATGWAISYQAVRRPWLTSGWLLLAVGLTLAYQLHLLADYPLYVVSVAGVASGLLLIAVGVWLGSPGQRLNRGVISLTLLALLVAPFIWASLTTLNRQPNTALPRSGPTTDHRPHPNSHDRLSQPQQNLLDYLMAQTDPAAYLVATTSSREAAPLIIATSRPVLTFGGFNGRDEVINETQLAEMVTSGELRFVLSSRELAHNKPTIANWLTDHCSLVALPGLAQKQTPPPVDSHLAAGPPPGRPERLGPLFDCAAIR